ncbi:Fatty acid synthesis PlsX protein [Syntrophomonas zehnderi OL-4]|uniref:Phosphate acyltransferase n=1 Tax=Syntrophomonas zehnderi OL-4 TaxID=690567 RepID=A0A0E4GC71_9FIRM|nr:phosphate acyltransferase PlsX [Syntrophomonas zehnderi]CFY05281.1 Fatty acid synthesis PlsX protein [Syntrophomonas zehnderi OL-4]
MRLAIDVMGGDYAPREIVAGALQWAEQSEDTLLLVGNEYLIKEELQLYQYPTERLEIIPASQVVEMNESPASALRKKKDASIIVATRLIQAGQADAVVSCGSTGAQLAAAIFILGRLEGIDRPPIVASIPNQAGSYSLVVDVGANVDCKATQLLQFALLGKAYASIVMQLGNPRIGLLNNGEEEGKGNSLAIEAYKLLKDQKDLNFVGNIEGRDLFADKCDVIVCDGFIGNIVLKNMEGLAALVAQACIAELGRLPAFFERFDYTRVGGAPLLGVNGVSIVCHGSSKREAVFNGIKTATECVKKDIINQQKIVLQTTV